MKVLYKIQKVSRHLISFTCKTETRYLGMSASQNIRFTLEDKFHNIKAYRKDNLCSRLIRRHDGRLVANAYEDFS